MKGRISLKRKLRGLNFNPVRSSLLITVLTALLLGCGSPGDPILDHLYTQNVLPGTDGVYSVGSEDYYYEDGFYGQLHLNEINPLQLTGDALVYIEVRPDIDFVTIQAHGKPTWVIRGIIGGWSFPIYAAVNEELFLETHIPHRWDGASDILVHIHCYLAAANIDKRFNIQLSWEGFSDGDIIPNTSNDLTVETLTGTAPQYQSFHLQYTIDYDIDIGDELLSSDELHFRIRRLAASQDEIAGEVVITHVGGVFRRDKLGSSEP